MKEEEIKKYEYIKEANNIASISVNENFKSGGPFGAIIVKDGNIIARARNTVLESNDPTAHAEISAIRKAGSILNTHDLSGCQIYTTCYPCPMCLSAIIWSNIKEVYYGNTKEDAADIGFRDDMIYDFIKGKINDKSVLKLEQVGRDLTIELFEEFKNNNSKNIY